MNGEELAAIRAASSNQGPDTSKSEAAANEEETRRDILATILDSDARERLSRIALVNPDLSSKVQTILFRMAQTGQIRGRVTEQQLIGLLDQAEGIASSSSGKKGTVIFQRRKGVYDDDDDDF
ncbi:PDCD5-related protein [Cantharellus anzutake]|uniref:PDCD5-related protein n=1 Tax=Cantharellus anzutake TaxID=1750568 RepID=UPI001905A65E|nr:PDCD5-related protein [Cantharellus anzutake]KAF8333954.1 PDCD5-related protein [Cantharellus anzutake]